MEALIAHLRRLWRRFLGRSRAQIVRGLMDDALRKAKMQLTFRLHVPPAMQEDLDALACHMNRDNDEVISAGVRLLAEIARDGGPIVCDIPRRCGLPPRRLGIPKVPLTRPARKKRR